MLRFIFRKLLSNKTMNLCLMTGVVFWIALFTMIPVFSNGAVNRILTASFTDYAEENGKFPAVIGRRSKVSSGGEVSSAELISGMSLREEEWLDETELSKAAGQQVIWAESVLGKTSYGGRNKKICLAYRPDFENAAEITDEGEPAYNTGKEAYPVYISEYTMDELSLVAGEELYFDDVADESGELLRLQIVGIFRTADGHGGEWYNGIEDYKNMAFTDEESFDEIRRRFGITEINTEDFVYLDYRDIRFDNADRVIGSLENIAAADEDFEYNFKDITLSYKHEKNSINSIMLSAGLPLFALLITFMIMVSGSIVDNEKSEMAVLRSRGIKRGEMIILYFLRSLILTLIAVVPGIALGMFLVWVGRQTNGFLVFQAKEASDYYLSGGSVLAAAVGALSAVLIVTIPVIGLSGKTIIDSKNESHATVKKPLWKKLFIDVILTAVSLYLLHNYTQQSRVLSEKLINGENIDPFIMLGSSVFIIGIGLFLLRVIDILVRIIFAAGRKHWGASAFAGFLQIIRSGGRQGIISVFMVLTLAMGVFDASLARTVNDNNIDRIEYDLGADVRMTGNWVRRMRFNKESQPVYFYDEPDYADYRQLYEDGILQNMTRVIYDTDAEVSTRSKTITNVIMMGINTTEFGRTADLKDGLNSSHWFNSLNAIAESADGLIISSNLAEDMKVKVGDRLKVIRHDIDANKTETGSLNLVVRGIVDAWPGYERYTYRKDENGSMILRENYLAVMNYATADSGYSLSTYDIWGRLPSGSTAEDFRNEIEKRGIKLQSLEILSDKISEMQDSAMIQITNGLFSVSFLMSIIICIIGFLIYWITSVRRRALQFGIHRAMGLRMGEVVKMLVMEHFFSSFLAVAAGVGAGILAASLYDKIIAVVYLPEKHTIPIGVSMPVMDIVKPLIVIAAALIVAFFVISRIIKGLKISETLKMGEDS